MSETTSTGQPEILLPDANDAKSIYRWRKQQREKLIRARLGIGSSARSHCTQALVKRLTRELAGLDTGCIGFYWPIKGEFDLRKTITESMENGWQAALPAVLTPAAPMEFRHWEPGVKLVPGIWNIPVPETRELVTPDVLVVPLVGFDDENYRLGYGGGYYDRTIAAFDSRPFTIGVGLDTCRLETIYPQWHDIPMDRIVTVSTQIDVD